MKISVCIATFNGAKFIEQQVKSILEQLSSDDELIISDDGSTDLTLDILKSFHDNRIKIFFNCIDSRGYTKNFENALKNSNGDIIFLADQDDLWFSDKIVTMKLSLDDDDFVVSDAVVVNEDLQLISRSNFDLRNVKHGFINNFIRCRYLGCCYAFNRSVLNRALPFPEKHLLLPHDYWILMVAFCFFRVTVLDVPLIYYRRHDSNISNGGDPSNTSFYFKVKYRIYLLLSLLKRLLSS